MSLQNLEPPPLPPKPVTTRGHDVTNLPHQRSLQLETDTKKCSSGLSKPKKLQRSKSVSFSEELTIIIDNNDDVDCVQVEVEGEVSMPSEEVSPDDTSDDPDNENDAKSSEIKLNTLTIFYESKNSIGKRSILAQPPTPVVKETSDVSSTLTTDVECTEQVEVMEKNYPLDLPPDLPQRIVNTPPPPSLPPKSKHIQNKNYNKDSNIEQSLKVEIDNGSSSTASQISNSGTNIKKEKKQKYISRPSIPPPPPPKPDLNKKSTTYLKEENEGSGSTLKHKTPPSTPTTNQEITCIKPFDFQQELSGTCSNQQAFTRSVSALKHFPKEEGFDLKLGSSGSSTKVPSKRHSSDISQAHLPDVVNSPDLPQNDGNLLHEPSTAIRDLLESEKHYIEHLRKGLQIAKKLKKERISAETIYKFFGLFEEIYFLHDQYYQELKFCKNLEHIAYCFWKHIPKFDDVYIERQWLVVNESNLNEFDQFILNSQNLKPYLDISKEKLANYITKLKHLRSECAKQGAECLKLMEEATTAVGDLYYQLEMVEQFKRIDDIDTKGRSCGKVRLNHVFKVSINGNKRKLHLVYFCEKLIIFAILQNNGIYQCIDDVPTSKCYCSTRKHQALIFEIGLIGKKSFIIKTESQAVKERWCEEIKKVLRPDQFED